MPAWKLPWPALRRSRKCCAASARTSEPMADFQYVAVNAAGDLVRGNMEAASEQEAVERLRSLHHVPIRARPAAGRTLFAQLLSMPLHGQRGLSRQDVTNVTRELAIMLRTGQDLDSALAFLVEVTAGGRVRGIMAQVRSAVRDGSSL